MTKLLVSRDVHMNAALRVTLGTPIVWLCIQISCNSKPICQQQKEQPRPAKMLASPCFCASVTCYVPCIHTDQQHAWRLHVSCTQPQCQTLEAGNSISHRHARIYCISNTFSQHLMVSSTPQAKQLLQFKHHNQCHKCRDPWPQWLQHTHSKTPNMRFNTFTWSSI